MVSDTVKLGALAGAITLAMVAQSDAQGKPRFRNHTATKAQEVRLVAANRTVSGSEVTVKDSAGAVTIRANGIPTHAVGQFPNRGNPHKITAQRYNFEAEKTQAADLGRAFGLAGLFGVGLNGVPFDPGAAEFWKGNPNSGWQYEALGGAVRLGLDENHAHVQPSGAYHYHGLPWGLMKQLGWSAKSESPLIGYAADGFPIYALNATVNGKVVEMTSSYQLKQGRRPGGTQPSGKYDGAFVQDYQFAAGSGSLDECNGAKVVTEDYPQGTYAYFLTEDFPVIPRCLKGGADRSFMKRRRRG